MKLWVDDMRPAPPGYQWAKSTHEAIIHICQLRKPDGHHNIEILDLDHDAGEYAFMGGDYIEILKWMECHHAKFFEGKLNKGETVYYEIVGFTNDGVPIMPMVANSKISDKEFSKKYGKVTIFSYGCDPKGLPDEPQSACYVYRMTMTNEDGDVVEYTPDFMRYRCEQMGVKCVPVLWKGYLPIKFPCYEVAAPIPTVIAETPGEYIKNIAERYYDGPDPIGKTHVREGVVIRIVNRPKFCAYKHKNFSFKVLEGIAKDLAAEPDMEEAQDVADET